MKTGKVPWSFFDIYLTTTPERRGRPDTFRRRAATTSSKTAKQNVRLSLVTKTANGFAYFNGFITTRRHYEAKTIASARYLYAIVNPGHEI